MLWRRRGLILSPPTGSSGTWRTHCQMPILHHLGGGRWRLYFSGRDHLNRSHGFSAELDLSRGVDLVEINLSPVLSPGERGAFDADGAMPSSLLQVGDELWLFYIGWTVRRDVPFQTAVGLAISRDGGATFTRGSLGPVLGQSRNEQFSASAPLVIRETGFFRMIYSSIQSWGEWKGRPEPRYLLKGAISNDGKDWCIVPKPALDFMDEDEGGITRPSIVRRGKIWHMCYSCRSWKNYRENSSQAYHFGYATSADGESWTRRDGEIAFINPPEPGDWDAMMQAYPALIEVGDQVICFYSGDGFGKAGIGYATLEGGVRSLGA